MTITIIEGPDCSGKTTLMKQAFPAIHGYVHEHCGPPSVHGPWHDYTQILLKHWRTPSMHVVLDRFVYGELIYGPLLRPAKATNFTTAHVRMLERVLLSLGTTLIEAQTDYPTSEAIWRERQQEELIEKQELLKAVWERFNDLFEGQMLTVPNVPRISYDFQADTLEHVAARADRARSIQRTGPGIGSWRPGQVVLMVGEAVNDNTAVHQQWPFVAEGGSSLWLSQQLEELGVNEQSLYWINSLTSGLETSGDFLPLLQPIAAIALGKAAAVWCKRRGLIYHELTHPQYHKRFKSSERYALGDLLPSLLATSQGELST